MLFSNSSRQPPIPIHRRNHPSVDSWAAAMRALALHGRSVHRAAFRYPLRPHHASVSWTPRGSTEVTEI